MRHSLYKYFSDLRWTEAFLEGEVRFRSLAYFRDYEDEKVRGDRNEGTAIYRPKEGLVINNQTQGKTFTLTHHAFESSVNQEEIFVFCLSRSITDELRRRFEAPICVEILNTQDFCARIEAALPAKATFPGKPGRTRIGQRVEYYKETDGGDPRWALPDVIATSKLDSYSWQDEYRLVFCLTDALAFEKVVLHLVGQNNNAGSMPHTGEHLHYDVKAGDLSDICRLHKMAKRA